MTAHRFQDSARYWRTPLLPGADLLTAEYHDHEFSPHWHDAYTIPVIVAGAEGYRYLGSDYVAEAGSVPIINPGELHTGSKAVEAGWRYRVMYAPVDFMHELANDVAGKPQALPWFAPGVIRDPDLAQRLARAHRLLEAGDDPLAAEAAMLDALSTLAGPLRANAAGTRARLAADDARVATMKERLTGDLVEACHVSRSRTGSGTLALPRRAPFHADHRIAAPRMAQPGALAARARAIARRRFRDGCRRGERFHGSKPFHAPFPAHVRRAAGALARQLTHASRPPTARPTARTYKPRPPPVAMLPESRRQD